MKLIRRLSSVALLGCLLMPCNGCDDLGSSSIHLGEGWIRAMPLLAGPEGLGTNSAAYLRLRNNGAQSDRLLGAESSAASRVEIHESWMEGDVMRMRQVDALDLPPRSEVELRPGGLHLMLLGLTGPLIEGEEIELELHFERAGDRTATLPVRSVGGG